MIPYHNKRWEIPFPIQIKSVFYISLVEYNFLNLPSKIEFMDGSTTLYTYKRTKVQLKDIQSIGAAAQTHEDEPSFDNVQGVISFV